ncbi:hypothetical protein PACTADRAFT_50549 [Pachysolen tannophilus NRRL Y-2460]|uniref:Gag1-like clamp domain-containing protein n=1 Tax=Pachysolen tannophilus NRRL Y-2460 TaxID=669874 RepID=A0A1E4TSG4_PACTA|nr:hypothetical protein PACTADRAFT_50549 [Pachysolen tannophilus NRRL Y-2460]
MATVNSLPRVTTEEEITLKSEDREKLTSPSSTSNNNTPINNSKTTVAPVVSAKSSVIGTGNINSQIHHNNQNILQNSGRDITRQTQPPLLANSNTNNNNIKNNNNNNNIQETNSEKTLARRIKNLFIRISFNLSLFLTRLRFISDEVLSSDEIEREIFCDTDSSSIPSELLDQTAELGMPPPPPPTTTTILTTAQQQQQQQQESPSEFSKNNDIRNIDIFEKAEELRRQNGNDPFILGEQLWEIQNKQWLIPSPENSTVNGKLKLQKKLAEQELKHVVSTKDYSIVYNNLVLKNKTLRNPMNLKDLIKVINAGWIIHKNWERAAKGLP